MEPRERCAASTMDVQTAHAAKNVEFAALWRVANAMTLSDRDPTTVVRPW